MIQHLGNCNEIILRAHSRYKDGMTPQSHERRRLSQTARKNLTMVRIYSITALFLAGHVSAQSNSSFKDCPLSIRNIATENRPYNSTGTLSVEIQGQDDPWQISVAVTDRRAPYLWFGDLRSDQETNSYLSVPESLVGSSEGRETFVCLYMMRGVNQTATNATEADDSCNDILSDECIEEFNKAPTSDGKKCPTVSASEKCGRFVVSQCVSNIHPILVLF